MYPRVISDGHMMVCALCLLHADSEFSQLFDKHFARRARIGVTHEVSIMSVSRLGSELPDLLLGRAASGAEHVSQSEAVRVAG